ncbi:MAG: hypothetical protein LBK23_08550 [Oscillospiraceae bacterium]|nr:hypothetical protein [Oscillospiraceae bacterium]
MADAVKTEKKPRRKKGGKRLMKKRGPRRRGILTVVLPMLFIIIAAVAAVFFVQNARSYRFAGAASQFYAGGEYRIPADAVMRRADGASTIYYEGVTRDAVNLPIYRSDTRAVVLPQDMVYYDPRAGTAVRSDYFTELRYDENGFVTAVRGGASRGLSQGFLYDGRDTYLFLEPVTLRFNGYRIELSAMSFAEAIYDGQIMLYDRESGETTFEPPQSAVICESAAGDYTVSLLSDYLEKADGARTLLFTNPALLEPLLR